MGTITSLFDYSGDSGLMRHFAGLVLALALGVVGCSDSPAAGGSAGDGGAGGLGGAGGQDGSAGMGGGSGGAVGQGGQGGIAGAPPTEIWWESTEQTQGPDFNYDSIFCSTGSCTDGQPEDLERVTSGTGFALRSFGDMTCDVTPCVAANEKIRAQARKSLSSGGADDAFDNGDPIWIYREMFLPHALNGSGWFMLFDLHVLDAQGDRLAPNPGVYFKATNGTNNGYIDGKPPYPDYGVPNVIGTGWSNVPTADSAPSASPPGSSNYVGLPVGEWFELEFRFVASDFDVANGSFQIWLNNTVVVDQGNIITVGTDTGSGDTGPWERFEFYDPKLYGAPTFTDWEDDKGTKEVRWYTRNVKVASAKLSDGDAGDPSPPINEGGNAFELQP